MNLLKKNRESSEVFTDALNDILFILLMFFLIVSTLANPNVRKASLPKAKSNTTAKQSVAVTIDSFNRFYVEAKPIEAVDMFAALKEKIDTKRANGEEPTIAVNADRNCKLESFAAVLRAADSLKVKAVMSVNKKGLQ